MILLIISHGYGFLVFVIAFGSCLATHFITSVAFGDSHYSGEHAWPVPLALIVAGIACYYLGRKLNSGKPRTLFDPALRQSVILVPPKHRLYFIPVEYWGPILFVLAIAVFLAKL